MTRDPFTVVTYNDISSETLSYWSDVTCYSSTLFQLVKEPMYLRISFSQISNYVHRNLTVNISCSACNVQCLSLTCQNEGIPNYSNCSCVCNNGWTGTNCQTRCK